MSQQLSLVTPELIELEDGISSLLGRVERRQQAEPAVAADGDINKILQGGLQNTMSLTQEFMVARARTENIEIRSQTLVGLAHGMTRVTEMIEVLQGERHLSPLFDRIVDREYNELHVLMKQMYDIVTKDSAEISAAFPQEGHASQSSEGPVVQAPAPLVLALTIMFMPVAIASGIMSGFMAGMRDAGDSRKAQDQNATQTTRPHLRLVQG